MMSPNQRSKKRRYSSWQRALIGSQRLFCKRKGQSTGSPVTFLFHRVKTDSFFDFNQQLSWAGQSNRHAIPNSWTARPPILTGQVYNRIDGFTLKMNGKMIMPAAYETVNPKDER
jgi:hypothetical protein